MKLSGKAGAKGQLSMVLIKADGRRIPINRWSGWKVFDFLIGLVHPQTEGEAAMYSFKVQKNFKVTAEMNPRFLEVGACYLQGDIVEGLSRLEVEELLRFAPEGTFTPDDKDTHAFVETLPA